MVIITKVCTICKLPKSLDKFSKDKTRKDGLNAKCNRCNKLNNSNWYKRNADRIKLKSKNWRKNNPILVKLQSNKQSKKRRATLKGKLDSNMGTALWRMVKGKKATQKWSAIFGYTIDDLILHITPLLRNGMTWENYGKWHIDHIVPKVFFKYNKLTDQEFQYCWSLDNLQPLWAEDNWVKNDKLENELAKGRNNEKYGIRSK